MGKYKLKFTFDNFGPKFKKYTIWICNGRGNDGLPCGFESQKSQTVRHYAAKHLKLKASKQPQMSVLLRDYDIRITRGSRYLDFRKTSGTIFSEQ